MFCWNSFLSLFFLGNVCFSEFLILTCFCFPRSFEMCFCRFGGKSIWLPTCHHQRTPRPVTSPSFHPTTLFSLLSHNHTLPPHNHTLPSVTQDLTPDLTPTHHTCIPGTPPHTRTYHDHAESIIRYTSPTTHPSQPIYTFNEIQKRKRKRNKGGETNKS